MEIPTNWMVIALAAAIGASVALVAPAMLRRVAPTRRPARLQRGLTVIDGGKLQARPARAPGPPSRERMRRAVQSVTAGIQYVRTGWRLGIRAGAFAVYVFLTTTRWLSVASLVALAVGAGVWLAGVHWKMDGPDLVSRILTPAVALGGAYLLVYFLFGRLLRAAFGLVRGADPGRRQGDSFSNWFEEEQERMRMQRRRNQDYG